MGRGKSDVDSDMEEAKASGDEGETSEQEEEYIVETILDKRIVPATGRTEYLLKWKGYGEWVQLLLLNTLY